MKSESIIKNAARLVAVLTKLGIRIDLKAIRDSFEERLYIQKLIYMLKLHPEYNRYLDFAKYSMYLYGPYSPELAQVYYNMPEPETLPSYKITISNEALEYGRELIEMSPEDLEIMATLIEILRTKPFITREAAIRLVYRLKFYLGRSMSHIEDVLRRAEILAQKYNLVAWPGSEARSGP